MKAVIVLKFIYILLGIFMVIVGLNKFLVFMEIPHPVGDGGKLMDIYITSGFIKIIGVLQILGGSALLINKFVPLALTFITAIMFNATIFHILHDPLGIGGAIICLLLSIILIYDNKDHFSPLLKV